MKFRKKPIIVNAEQFLVNCKPWPAGVVEAPSYWENTGSIMWRYFRIKTREGFSKVSNRDWIITGIMGERYPCPPAIFKKTYERIE